MGCLAGLVRNVGSFSRLLGSQTPHLHPVTPGYRLHPLARLSTDYDIIFIGYDVVIVTTRVELYAEIPGYATTHSNWDYLLRVYTSVMTETQFFTIAAVTGIPPPSPSSFSFSSFSSSPLLSSSTCAHIILYSKQMQT